MQPLKGKVALITGGSRGIGSAIARKFAAAGADVAINHRRGKGSSHEKALSLKKEIEENGSKAEILPADIASKDSVRGLFESVKERFGRLDYLILNAARAPFKPFAKLPERELRQLVETNYMGNIFCIQEAVPMLSESRGVIVFISSLGSRFQNPAYPLGSMKAAMESVVRDCSEELRDRGISVNAVSGGLVKTDSFKVLRQYWEELDAFPEEAFVEPDEIADVVLFLCSPAARGIRGQTIVVDKGLSSTLFHKIKI
jgi:NAD(P)-dependent dehydrogenase (short-subunit alcohol dehydrogenase family)